MRVRHSPCSWLNEIEPLDSVAGNTLIGMFTRLIFRKPFQVGRAAMAYLLLAQEPVKKYDVERRTRSTRSKTLSIFLCGFSGFCVVRDFFTRSQPGRF